MPRPKRRIKWFERERATQSQRGEAISAQAPFIPARRNLAKRIEERRDLAFLMPDVNTIRPECPMSEKQRIMADCLFWGYDSATAYKVAYGQNFTSMNAFYQASWETAQRVETRLRINQLERIANTVVKDEAERRKALVISGLEDVALDRAHSQRVKALELLGKMRGVDLFSERIEQVKGELTADQVEAQLRQRLEALGLTMSDVAKPERKAPLALPAPQHVAGVEETKDQDRATILQEPSDETK